MQRPAEEHLQSHGSDGALQHDATVSIYPQPVRLMILLASVAAVNVEHCNADSQVRLFETLIWLPKPLRL